MKFISIIKMLDKSKYIKIYKCEYFESKCNVADMLSSGFE